MDQDFPGTLWIDSSIGTSGTRPWRWILVLALALLLHLLLLITRNWIPILSHPGPPPRVEIQQVDPRKLEAIRRQWKDKSILLDKNPSQPSAKEPSPDARYLSDRNIRVEKEQRARNSQVMPQPGGPSRPAQEDNRDQRESQSAEQSKPEAKRSEPKPPALRNLRSLGVPIPLEASQPKSPQEAEAAETDSAPSRSAQSPRSASAQAPGADQALHDPNLPEGSENLLNTQESVYYSFYARIYETVGPMWQSRVRATAARLRLKPGDYTTAVDVVMDREGNIIDVRLLQSSGERDLDEVVDWVWRRAKQFANPPKGLLNERGEVHTGWNFTITVNEGFGPQFLPPERHY